MSASLFRVFGSGDGSGAGGEGFAETRRFALRHRCGYSLPGRSGRDGDSHTAQFGALECQPGRKPDRHHDPKGGKGRPAAAIFANTRHQIAPLCGANEMKGTPKKVAKAMI